MSLKRCCTGSTRRVGHWRCRGRAARFKCLERSVSGLDGAMRFGVILCLLYEKLRIISCGSYQTFCAFAQVCIQQRLYIVHLVCGEGGNFLTHYGDDGALSREQWPYRRVRRQGPRFKGAKADGGSRWHARVLEVVGQTTAICYFQRESCCPRQAASGVTRHKCGALVNPRCL
eukprot:6201615-Pleurochrysis_carterae.AAC.1